MKPPERITMTFAGLSLIDYFVVLAFGKEKKKPLQQMFSQGSLEEVPARFFMHTAPNNTVVITDQQV
jgi:6-phosphogluconolactonase/glucosamine-6-phosphate isomerase/deaminase